MKEVYSIKDARNKIEHYCAYQERCHTEVEQKLRTMKMDSEEIDEIIAHLIGSNFLTKSALPAVLPEENTASSNGERSE
jgi:regulatory protein